MASDAVKRVLAAESESDRLMAEARQRRDDIINEANGNSALAIQKKITEATATAGKIRAEYAEKSKKYAADAEDKCNIRLDEIRSQAESSLDKAADAVIKEYF